MSGRPVAAPALSLHEFMPLTSCRNSAVVPTSASESPHAAATAFGRVGRAQLRVALLDDDLAAREAALGVDVVAPRLHAVPRTLEQAGPDRVVDVGDHRHRDRRRRDADLGALQRRVALAGAVATDVVRSRRRGRRRRSPPFPPLPPPHAATTSTKAVARTHQRSRILFSPGSLDGPKRTDIVHGCRSGEWPGPS